MVVTVTVQLPFSVCVMSGKRKRVVVSLETKWNALKRLDKGESIKKIAVELGVGKVIVGDWKRKRSDIEKWVNERVSAGGSGLSRKTMKKGEYEQTSEALFLWFSQLRATGSPVSGPMLQAKALDFHKQSRMVKKILQQVTGGLIGVKTSTVLDNCIFLVRNFRPTQQMLSNFKQN